MSVKKIEIQQAIEKMRIDDEQILDIHQQKKSFKQRRRSATRLINCEYGLGLLTSYSTKFIKKHSERLSVSPPKISSKRPSIQLHKQKRKSVICTTQQTYDPRKSHKQISYYQNNEQKSSGALQSSLQDQINKIKALSRFMLDLKLPSALPTKPIKFKKSSQLLKQQNKPLIQVKMQRKNGFIRPTMLVRDNINHQNETKQPQRRVKSVIVKSKQKLKTAPALIEFGLHIQSHQQVMDQQQSMKQTKNQLIRRFRSTWTKKIHSKSKKLPQIQVSPWAVTQNQYL